MWIGSTVTRFFATCGAVLLLAGCLSTPPSSLIKLSRLSPLEANPADIRLAVEAPDKLLVRDGDVRLRISYEASDPANSFVEEYGAIVATLDRPTPGLTPPTGNTRRVFIAALTAEDAISMAAAQTRIRSLRSMGDTGSGSIAINASGCARQPFGDEPVFVKTWMQTAPTDPFFIINRNLDLRKTAQTAGVENLLFAPCIQ